MKTLSEFIIITILTVRGEKKGKKWLNSYFNILLSCKISNLLAFWLALTSIGIKKQGQLFSQKRVLSALCNTEHIKHIWATACQSTSVPLSSPTESWRYILGYHQHPKRNWVYIFSLSFLGVLFTFSWKWWERRTQLHTDGKANEDENVSKQVCE